MRKIEQDMLKAINAGRNWQQDNTRVHAIIGGMEVQLHGNIIAVYEDVGGGDWQAVPNLKTFKKYPTRTTCSRLRALGIGAHIVKGQPHIDGVKVVNNV